MPFDYVNRGNGKRQKKKGKSTGEAQGQPPVAAPQGPGSRAPLLTTPPPRRPTPPALEVVYVGVGGTRRTMSDILSERGVRIPENLRNRLEGMDFTVEQINLVTRNYDRMQSRAHAVSRELGVLAPLGERNFIC